MKRVKIIRLNFENSVASQLSLKHLCLHVVTPFAEFLVKCFDWRGGELLHVKVTRSAIRLPVRVLREAVVAEIGAACRLEQDRALNRRGRMVVAIGDDGERFSDEEGNIYEMTEIDALERFELHDQGPPLIVPQGQISFVFAYEETT